MAYRYNPRLEASRARRLIRQHERAARYRVFLLFLPVGGLLLLAVEMHRAYSYTQKVAAFSATIDQMPPVQLRQQVEYFAVGLDDFDPLIRNASAVALKVATKANLGADVKAWRTWWRAHQAAWAGLTNLDWNASVVSPQPARPIQPR
jgi:hypothetical protein